MWKTKNSLSLKSFAKINLFLKVLGKRPDGYHNILTGFQSIELHDDLIFSSGRQGINLTIEGADLPSDARNMVVQAASLFTSKVNREINVDISLTKRIPIEGGLGGGSSNAACTLFALNRIASDPLSFTELQALALQLGSDVPYFLSGGLALGEGRGEVLTQLEELPQSAIMIVVPPFGVKTVDIYTEFRLTTQHQKSNITTRCRAEGEIRKNALGWQNDLEAVVFAKHPELREVKISLLDNGAEAAILCGSGSCIAARFENSNIARHLAIVFEKEAFNVIMTRTITALEYQRGSFSC